MPDKKTYQQGVIDGIALWGRTCGKESNCEGCPIGSIRGAGVTCQDFARQFPAKMASILKEMDEGQITYFEEYCLRFPSCQLDVEQLALVACRKACFEGNVSCKRMEEEGACEACWKEVYVADVSGDDEEDSSGSFL